MGRPRRRSRDPEPRLTAAGIRISDPQRILSGDLGMQARKMLTEMLFVAVPDATHCEEVRLTLSQYFAGNDR